MRPFYIPLNKMPKRSPQKRIGSRAMVMHGNAHHTSGGLTKKSLKRNKRGRIVSRKKSAAAKKTKFVQEYKDMRFQKKRKSPRKSTKRKSQRKSPCKRGKTRRGSPSGYCRKLRSTRRRSTRRKSLVRRKSCKRGQIRDRSSKRCRRKKCYPKVRDRSSKRCRSPRRKRSRR